MKSKWHPLFTSEEDLAEAKRNRRRQGIPSYPVPDTHVLKTKIVWDESTKDLKEVSCGPRH